ncbi:MAG: hypothetical protein ABWY06_10245 [Pseudomonas sp.]|uniref:hypothetical protein n=1 Tax=Pseudomonas sp. TaxID=306 RepID=UPI003390E437
MCDRHGVLGIAVMAYDLVVGPGAQFGDAPDQLASIDFDQLPVLSRLRQRGDCAFLERISNPFEDQRFSRTEVEQALEQLRPLRRASLTEEERCLLDRLIAVLSFASHTQQELHGLAD